MPNEHWWNADFDLALQPGWFPALKSEFEIQVRELTLHALMAAEPEDSVLVYDSPPEAFLHYLEDRGINTPRFSILPEVRPEFHFKPYGWSAKAITLKDRYDLPPVSPTFEAVRHVNGRSFGHFIEREILDSPVSRGQFRSVSDLNTLLASEAERAEGWVVKTEHGNAALGNRRLRNQQLQPDDLRWLNPRLQRGSMVLEWWLPRTMDLCTVFDLSADGTVDDYFIHESIHTSAGGFIGAVYDQEVPPLDVWHNELTNTAEIVASALAREGYFGPVCIDAFVWNDNGTKRLRPLVDINARHYASEGWRRLAHLWGSCVYGRFFSCRKLRLPRTYEEFETALSGDAWNSLTGNGVLLTSPMWLEDQGNPRRPRKLGVVFRESSKESVLALEKRFRETFER